jgi:hypothetical protein
MAGEKIKVIVKVNKWDKEVDGKQVRVRLPNKFIIILEEPRTDVMKMEELYDTVMDVITNKTGFCIHDCKIKQIIFDA